MPPRPLDEASAAHPTQLMREPTLFPCQRLAEFVDAERPSLRQGDQHVVIREGEFAVLLKLALHRRL